MASIYKIYKQKIAVFYKLKYEIFVIQICT